MTTDQCIQLGIAIISKMMDQWIQLGIAVILAVTLSLILRQVRMQGRLLKDQLQYNQFQMYAKVNEPVSDERIEELKLYPQDYMDVKLYEEHYKDNNKDNNKAIHKYLYMSDLYEYLAFSYAMPPAEIPSIESLKKWTSDLCEEREFREVHKYYWKYYPTFAEVVKKLLKEKGLGQDQSRAKVQGNTEAKSTG